jgi:hypothetical protein
MVAGQLVNKVIAYENGEMSPEDTVSFFADLIKTGDAWRLQGHYGRRAASLIEAGVIDKQGNILQEVELP